jgi:hypothetical protein
VTQPRLIIATPVDGTPTTGFVSCAYHNAVNRLYRAGAVSVPSELMFSDDIVRARSRAAWFALQRPGWEWMLWIDNDTAFDDAIVGRMIHLALTDGHEFIAAPYPRKRIPAAFPYKPLDENIAAGRQPVVNDCMEVDYIGFGFVLLARSCLEKMTAHYYEEDWFLDERGSDAPHPTVGLFKQVLTSKRELLSEDYSFCHRWRAMGGKVQMYVGEGAPLGHVGTHVFVGDRQELGSFR